ncbi:MAG: DUF6498-containing protein [Gammaproteobacteria bacterium]|nr:DUF6498-containing protein [Gammaproteobacteria bacterium]
MPDDSQSARSAWLTPSAIVLIAANLVPLAGAVLFQWTVFEIVVLFWAENVVIGTLNVLRMLLASAGDVVNWMSKIFLIPFFVFHYGMFTFIHGVFVFTLFGGKELGSARFPDEIGILFDSVLALGLGIPLLALFLSHAFSFFWNYVGKGEYRNTDVKMLMVRPYGRIFVLHFTIIIGGFILLSLGSPLGGLMLLILLKIGFDLRAHRKEHKQKLKPTTEDEPTFKEILAQLKESKRRARRAPSNTASRQPGHEP